MKEILQQDKEQHLKENFKLPNPGLRVYFARTRLGNDEDYRTPLWKGEAREKVIKEWARILEESPKLKDYPSLLEYEATMRGKVGPMSVQKPLTDRVEDVLAYYLGVAEYDAKAQYPSAEDGKAALLQEWKSIRGLRPKSVDHALDEMRLNTNSGSPWFMKRKIPKVKEYSRNKAIALLDNGDESEAVAVLGWRGQEGGPTPADTKQRVVWMMPMHVNLAEATFYQPIIQALQNANLFPAYISTESVDQNITKMFDTKGAKDLVICTDFTKYDQHFNRGLQTLAYSVIKHLMSSNSTYYKLWDHVFPLKYKIPIQLDTNRYATGYHGMASGSGGTNVDESIVHRILQHQSAIENGTRLNRYSQCNGDDGVITYPGITVDKVIETYTKFGLEMNPDKQYASTQDCVYLRRWHSTSYRVDGVCVGVYSTYRALGRLLGQERFYDPEQWGPEMVVLRSLSILENCKHHPLFHEFIDFVLKGDKFRLGLDLPGFYESLTKWVHKAIEMKDTFLGYNRSNMLSGNDNFDGISNWAVVKYLLQLKKGS